MCLQSSRTHIFYLKKLIPDTHFHVGSSFFFYREPDYPRDCSEVQGSCFSSVSSGVYLIKPDGYKEPFEAYCNYDTDVGGWTVSKAVNNLEVLVSFINTSHV